MRVRDATDGECIDMSAQRNRRENRRVLGRPHLEDSVLEAFQTPKMRVTKVSQVL